MSIAEDTRRPVQKSSTTRSPAAPAAADDEAAFRRRRTHSQIEAMTGLILQAVNFPTRRHRDFISALQSVNGGDAARRPHTPFRRAHLTIASLMVCQGSEDTRRKAVYREIRVLRAFERRTGIRLFKVTPGSDDEATEYVDYLTPLADSAAQRALSSPLWKTDKKAAKAEAVEWAIKKLPRVKVEEEPEAAKAEPLLADFEAERERRHLAQVERDALEIERRGGDSDAWLGGVIRRLQKARESLRKTAPARRDHAARRAVLDDGEDGSGADGNEVGGNTKGDRTVRPPLADTAAGRRHDQAPEGQEGADKIVLPLAANSNGTVAFPSVEPTLFAGDAGTSPPVTPLGAALSYARRGWPVFPLHHADAHRGCSCMDAASCRSPGKHPRTRKGLKDASTDPVQIRRWWERYPLANVGLAMGRKSGLVAVDVDPRAGGDASLSELIEAHGNLPATLEASTGGGGTHVFFAHPGVSFKNSSSVLGEGLDVKTDGGYVVAAPSLHATGKRYEWRSTRRPAQMPRWLLRLLTAEKPPASPKKSSPPATPAAPAAPAAGAVIPLHSRNTRLFRLACSLRGGGAGYDEIERAVFEAYELRCVKEPEPMQPAELRKIARSAMRYQPGP